MKTLYVANKRIYINTVSFYVEIGDILSFSAANKNTLTIYRKQKIVKTLPFSQGSLNGFVKSAMLSYYQPAAAPAPLKAPVITPDPLEQTAARAQAQLHQYQPCCSFDHDLDGNCHIHSAPGVFRHQALQDHDALRTPSPAGEAPVAQGESVKTYSTVNPVAIEPHGEQEEGREEPVAHENLVPVPMTQTEAEAVAVQQVSALPEVISGEVVPGAPTGFEAMTRDQLMAHAKTTLGLKLNPQTGEKKILEAIRSAERKRDMELQTAQPIEGVDEEGHAVAAHGFDHNDDGLLKVEA